MKRSRKRSHVAVTNVIGYVGWVHRVIAHVAHMKSSPQALSCVFVCLALSPVHAELPGLEEKRWIGSFAAYADKDLELRVLVDGQMVISPVYKGGSVRPYVRMPIAIHLEVEKDEGGVELIEIAPDSLKTDDAPTGDLEQVSFRGGFEGGGSFECWVEQKRGEVLIGGRVTDPGAHGAGKVRFRVTASILNFLGREKQKLANDPSAFEKLVRDDSLQLKSMKGKRGEFDFLEPVLLQSEEVNEDGASEASVEIGVLAGPEFQFESSKGSLLRFSNRRLAPLHEGFDIHWVTDSTLDPKGEARFSLVVD